MFSTSFKAAIMGSKNFQWTLAIKIQPLLGEWDPKVTGGSEGFEGSFVIFDENPNNIGVKDNQRSTSFGDWDPKVTEGSKDPL